MWQLDFISEANFLKHVQETISKYNENLTSVDLKKLNSNILDPIKLIFDKAIYKTTWEELIKSEILRQRDKSNNNSIGYFHQGIFNYFKNCTVPKNGWDVIYKNKNGIAMPDGSIVHTIFVEMKNKHNTMNSASSAKTFIKMQSQILDDDDCACFLVEAIAKKSQNIKWETTIDKKKHGHKLIRRVSLDEFYSLVTEQEDAFYKVCQALPHAINKAIKTLKDLSLPDDTAFTELLERAKEQDTKSSDLSIALALYLLAFKDYKGFND